VYGRALQDRTPVAAKRLEQPWVGIESRNSPGILGTCVRGVVLTQRLAMGHPHAVECVCGALIVASGRIASDVQHHRG